MSTPTKRSLKGRPASTGVASGRPVIVTSIDDMAKVQPGDILVAVETSIEFVPAMQRASAIITEQGGRNCHAAVWARENGKPAITQATEATGLLNEVPLVAMDGRAGLIEWEV